MITSDLSTFLHFYQIPIESRVNLSHCELYDEEVWHRSIASSWRPMALRNSGGDPK